MEYFRAASKYSRPPKYSNGERGVPFAPSHYVSSNLIHDPQGERRQSCCSSCQDNENCSESEINSLDYPPPQEGAQSHHGHGQREEATHWTKAEIQSDSFNSITLSSDSFSLPGSESVYVLPTAPQFNFAACLLQQGGCPPLPPPDFNKDPAKFNCGGLAFRSYLNINSKTAYKFLELAGRRTPCNKNQYSPGDRDCKPCDIKFYYWTTKVKSYYRERRRDGFGGEVLGPPEDVKLRDDYHIVSGQIDPQGKVPPLFNSKNGGNVINLPLTLNEQRNIANVDFNIVVAGGVAYKPQSLLYWTPKPGIEAINEIRNGKFYKNIQETLRGIRLLCYCMPLKSVRLMADLMGGIPF